MTSGIRAGILALLATAAALTLGLPAGLAAAAASPPRCLPSQLAAVYVNSEGAAGSVDGEYGFRNLTSRRCELSGYPTVQMLTASGGPLSTTEQHAPGAFGITVTRVTLGRNAVAYFAVHYAAATGYDNLHCPTSAALRLSAPALSASLVLHGKGAQIEPFGGTTVHLHCGIVDISPLSAKPFQ